ncbi:Alcohol dehydrogenase zinc-binding domain protein (plasmid) [Gemmatirosa kalamazoonensis]|uniref:Alcohol dehydrogenase zinc-binding domain protein n=1 Tax=Gemmatirosa kalamazoonensis TaxID=861299 RepID=W0RUZ2_9BACT|nr:zinc-binding dehydrogenase [Gemmatirosa kalamazoonensis]AHG93403.1 Alcohol dehydrogenase zinc-binding domain protein [Gemmatirosa kalamazoonensis]
MRAVSSGRMSAWTLREFGAPERFERTDAPLPTVRRGHVLIRVAATSVNPADLEIRDGRAAVLAPPAPMVLHMDVAGTVVAAADDVVNVDVGDEVYGCAGGLRDAPGALADYMLADARLVARKPDSLSLGEAAALPLAGLTAWDALRRKARVRRGDRVLVHGATGGVGHLAVQLAALDGAEVTATASSDAKLRVARELGATHVVNHRDEPTARYVARYTDGRGFDLVVDASGGAALAESLAAARPNGTVVTVATRGAVDLGPMLRKGLSLHAVSTLLPLLTGEGRERHGAMLRELAATVDAGCLCPLLDEARFTFDDVAAAHRRAASAERIGKVVLAHPEHARVDFVTPAAAARSGAIRQLLAGSR